mmetsp:Transcript_63773/g.71375  ORF Transcript_63773/g.71375 Transcript_63773/m.71375 type:complete len:132 (+) Transcript_63773:85-480(+)
MLWLFRFSFSYFVLVDLAIVLSGLAQNSDRSSERCLSSSSSSSSLPSSSENKYDSSSVCTVDKVLPSMTSGGLVFFLHIPKVRLLLDFLHTHDASVLTIYGVLSLINTYNNNMKERLGGQQYVVMLKKSNE